MAAHFAFKDFKPQLFREIREAYNIDDDAYYESFYGVRQHTRGRGCSMAVHNHHTALTDCARVCSAVSQTDKERFTGGGSGAFLYFSQDRRFIVKTLSQVSTLHKSTHTPPQQSIHREAHFTARGQGLAGDLASLCELHEAQPTHAHRQVLGLPLHSHVPAHHVLCRHGERSQL